MPDNLPTKPGLTRRRGQACDDQDVTDDRLVNAETARRWPKSEGRRLVVAGIAGIAVAVTAAFLVPWQLSGLLGWEAAAVILLVWIWTNIGNLNSEQTQQVALWEDSSRSASRLLLLLASVASLVGVLVAFVKAKSATGALSTVLTVSGLTTVIFSWLLVHTLFTLRYGHLYYEEPIGGIDFKSDDDHPDYRDFAYVAFTVGMTFQISDTDITSANMRRTVLRQSLLSYLFGTVIVATTINVLAGLIR